MQVIRDTAFGQARPKEDSITLGMVWFHGQRIALGSEAAETRARRLGGTPARGWLIAACVAHCI